MSTTEGYRVALSHVFVLEGTDLEASRVISRMLSSFERIIVSLDRSNHQSGIMITIVDKFLKTFDIGL